jgi:hypothetical protein
MQLVKPVLLVVLFEASFILLASHWKEPASRLNAPDPVSPTSSTAHPERKDYSSGPRGTSGAPAGAAFDFEAPENKSCTPAPRYRTWGDPSGPDGVKAANQTRWHCLPTYLGIGFPKCGSSTLWRYAASTRGYLAFRI